MKRFLVIIAILVSVNNAYSQVQRWTLQDCMNYAVQHHPRVHKQMAQNSSIHQSYLQAIGDFLPNISAGTSVGMNFGRALGDDNTYVDMNTFSNNYSVSGSLTIFDGLSNVNNLKMQRVNKLQGKHQLQNNKDQVAYSAMEAFLNVLYNKDATQLNTEQVETSKEELRRIRRKEELGLSGIPDLAEAEAKLAEDEYNLTRQSNMFNISIIILKERMNFPVDEDLELIEFADERIITKTTESPLQIYQHAIAHLPEAQIIESQLKANEYSHKAAKGAWLPRISVNGGYSTNFFRVMDASDYQNYSNQLKNKQGQYVGFNLSFPIFSGFRTSGGVKQSHARLVMARSDKEESLRKVYSDIEQAVADMNGKADEYYHAQKRVQAASVAHDVNKKKHNEGLISAIELSTSSNRLLNAKVQELNTYYQYHRTAKVVDYYKGEPYINE